jgi:membrane fusion protein, multidrug efflux system
MNTRTKRMTSGVIFLLLASGVWRMGTTHLKDAGPLSSAAAAVAKSPSVEVDIATVIGRTITDYQDYSGRLAAIGKVDIRPLVSGTIVAVSFHDGDLVKKGDALFTIDPRPYVAAVDQAAAQLAVAQAHDAYTATDAARATRLLSDNAIARRDFDLAQNASREASAGVKAAQAALETARINLSYAHIVAPQSGRVSRAELTVGNAVSTGANAPLLTTLVSVSPIYAEFDADEQTYLRYLAHDSKGNVPVSLGLATDNGFPRKGVIYSIDNRLDTTTGTIRVRARFENDDGALVPGLYARVHVGGGAPHAAILIDDAAIGTDQDKKFVLIVDTNNRVHYREVVLGEQHDGLRVIRTGLGTGDRIVVNGLQRVHPEDIVGVRVVPMSIATPAGSSAQTPS